MIRINLATRKRASSASPSGGQSLRLDAGQLKAFLQQLAEFPLQKIATVLVVGFVATYALSTYEESLVKEQQDELQKVLSEKPKLEAEASKMKGLQEIQNSMESDGKRIRTKLDTIKKLIADRGGAEQVLIELSKITPSTVWLDDFSLRSGDLTLKGASQDFSNVSEFTRVIQNSAMFSEMTLKDTQMAAEQGRQVATFQLTAKRRKD